MQALGGPDEDRRGGFERGGWALPLFNVDDEAATFLDQHAERACQAPRRRGSVARLRRRTGRSALCRACDLDPRWPRRRRRQALLSSLRMWRLFRSLIRSLRTATERFASGRFPPVREVLSVVVSS